MTEQAIQLTKRLNRWVFNPIDSETVETLTKNETIWGEYWDSHMILDHRLDQVISLRSPHERVFAHRATNRFVIEI